MSDSYTTNLNSSVPSTIPTDALSSNFNLQFPQSQGNDLNGYFNSFTNVQGILDQYFTSDLEKQRADQISQLQSSLDQYGQKGTRTQALSDQYGIGKDYESLKALNMQIAERLGQAGLEQQQQQGIGNTASTANAYSAESKRKALMEVGVLQAKQAALQGNIELSTKLVDQAVNLEFQPLENKINSIQEFLKLNEDQLSRADKKKADALKIILDQQQTQIDNQKQEKRDVLSLSNKYLDAGITGSDTFDQAQQKALNSPSYKTERQRDIQLATTDIKGLSTTERENLSGYLGEIGTYTTKESALKDLQDKQAIIKNDVGDKGYQTLVDEINRKFGPTDTVSAVTPSKPAYGTGNFKNTDLAGRVQQLKPFYAGSNKDLRAKLISEGYPSAEVTKAVPNVLASIGDSLFSFLFKK